MEWLLPAGLCVVLIMLTTLVVSLYALHRAINAEIEVKALKNSTHQIQFEPVGDSYRAPDYDDMDEAELNKIMDKAEAQDWDNLRDNSEPLA